MDDFCLILKKIIGLVLSKMDDFFLILTKNHRDNPAQKFWLITKIRNNTIEYQCFSSEIFENNCFYNTWDFFRNIFKKHFALELNFQVLKKSHLKIECWQVIGLIYRWKTSVFKKCNLKTPNIGFRFCCSKTPLHVTFLHFLQLFFSKSALPAKLCDFVLFFP